MKIAIKITLETEDGQPEQEIECWAWHQHRLEDIGMTLSESKSLLAAVQKILVQQQ